MAAKRPPAKAPARKKPAPKKAPARKAPARKPVAKKAPAKRPSGRARTAAKKATTTSPVVVVVAGGDLSDSVQTYIESRKGADDWTERHDALADTALVLARTLEAGAGLSTAAVARELRATLADLAPAVKEVSALDQLLAGLSAPLGHTEEP